MIIPNPTTSEWSATKGAIVIPPSVQECCVLFADDHCIAKTVDLDRVVEGAFGLFDAEDDFLVAGHQFVERPEYDDICVDVDSPVFLERPEPNHVGLVRDI